MKYALDLLHHASMIDAKPISTPFVVGQHLLVKGTLFSDRTLFRSLVGALQYLTITRPDLSFSVNSICQFMHAPTEDHFHALKRILRYVKGIAHHGLQLHKQFTRDLLGYSDVDWVVDSLTKGVTKLQFFLFRSKLSVIPSATLTLQAVIKENQILHDTCCLTFLLA
ncbi:hypothetical protein F2P56_017753 [Juglans regia]|uniref:Secreted RxLR effector protein 161-like n=2 Tax=Juglans regia TaxID=51240 RepID=A0A833U4M1_JUGRE|nr:uncharacterized mitochondrial protein AtMg00810-like [Juglans regia]XP_035549224.1 uncharacterized mitochondrial protein AtMg00810-like [Juglans regia]KAF5461671.1 hypothetical protein F2P56_017749 [Juglans regia]KAF5461675.1 hypothetical protein F2P56_017753 [Juglans regia]